ncbi:MAG: NADH-quinone reductase [Proteobacteria bacterium]|nr:NADH-quinone reductase [Desulfobacula sp.]MBU3954085.1 NADH-quinone reductase [Pseudomonadota bacterium]MBU4133086.1 NADH-quinone reductase [Pseudomonadota bacterium]
MEKIKLSKGFTPQLAGMPDTSLIQLPTPHTIGLSALDIPYIRPKLLVKENDPVKTGTPLFCDKRDTAIQYVSPGTGTVKKIWFGERRQLQEVVIALDAPEKFVQFDPVPKKGLGNISKQELILRLKQGGLWQSLRQFPAKDTADSSHRPAMIIVSLNGNDIFSPHPGILLDREKQAFEFGLDLLKHFSDRVIVTARHSSLGRLKPILSHITHTVADTYPAWDPGVVLFHLKKSADENTSWCITADHLVMMATFLITGRYPVERIVTVTKNGDKRPHILTRQGAPIKILSGSFHPESLVTTGRFNGRIADIQGHLGFFENTLNIIDAAGEDELFGFIRPGTDKTTVSRAFLSCLSKNPQKVDATLHGEERACINCSYCENICPNDLMPSFIMKALHSDEIEDALAYGLLDCCRCGLCAYTCPSKIELTQILSHGMDSHYKDKA